MAAEDANAIPGGNHDRASWVRLLFALYRTRRSGVLELRFGKRWRRYLVMAGDPIAYSSDQDEDRLGRTLVAARIVPEDRMRWLEDRLGPDEDLEDALLMAGVITPEQLTEHRQGQLASGIADALRWATGEWTFLERPDLASRIDPGLLPDPTTLHALWVGVRQHVSMDEVLPTMTSLGTLTRSPEFEDWFPHFEVEAPFDDLASVIGSGCTVDVIYRRIPDRSGNLIKLLWLLDAAALFEREGRPNDATAALLDAPPERRAPKPRPRGTGYVHTSAELKSSPARDEPLPEAREASPRDVAAEQAEQIAVEHRKRMGVDYYAFLGLPSGASAEAIDRRCKRMAARYRAAANEIGLPPEAREHANELLTGAHLVWRTLSDPERRTEYDRRLEAGQAPLLQTIKGADAKYVTNPGIKIVSREEIEAAGASLQGGHLRARRLMDQGEFREALTLLRKERLDNPSHPDVLTDLGWATWKVRAADDDSSEAEEFLQLAWTFDPKNGRAAGFLARIAMETGDDDAARGWLQRTVRLDPSAVWAKRALASRKSTPSAEVKRKSSPGLRFWRKGES